MVPTMYKTVTAFSRDEELCSFNIHGVYVMAKQYRENFILKATSHRPLLQSGLTFLGGEKPRIRLPRCILIPYSTTPSIPRSESMGLFLHGSARRPCPPCIPYPHIFLAHLWKVTYEERSGPGRVSSRLLSELVRCPQIG